MTNLPIPLKPSDLNVIGLVTKAYCGYYNVLVFTPDAVEQTTVQTIYLCKTRKNLAGKVLVGDQVTLSILAQQEGRIESILPRRNQLNKPPAANISTILVFFSFRSPDFQPALLDRFLLAVHHTKVHNLQIEVALGFNKADLAIDEPILAMYQSLASFVWSGSAASGENIDKLSAYLQGKRTLITGPSGTGKSTLLNRLIPPAAQKTAAVSVKIQRGKQTTRFVQLFSHEGIELLDSPGYSFPTDLPPVNQIATAFPDFKPHLGSCRFDDCLHLKEPGCRIKEMVAAGSIASSRYESYQTFVNESLDKKKNRFK